MTPHGPACVCAECCRRRGGREASQIRVTRTRGLPGVGAGRGTRSAGWGITRLVYGTAFMVALLLVLYSVATGR